MAPSASSGRTWLASSITSRSNDTTPGVRNCATEIGLINSTGLIRWIAAGAVRKSLRSAICCRLLPISPRKTFISP